MNDNFFNNEGKMSLGSTLVKSAVSLIIVIYVASYIITHVGPIFVGLTGLILAMVLGTLYGFNLRGLSRVTSIPALLLLFISGSILLGLFTGNAFVVIVSYTSRFAPSIGLYISGIILGALICTIIVLIGAIVTAPIMRAGFNSMGKLVPALVMVLVGFSIVSLVAFFLSVLGFESAWMFIVKLVYGLSPISIILAIIVTLVAAYMLVKTVSIITDQSGVAPRHKEYYYAILLSNSIVDLFLALFKLIMKIVAILINK